MKFQSTVMPYNRRHHSEGVMQTHLSSVNAAQLVGLYSLNKNLPHSAVLPDYAQPKPPNSLRQSPLFRPRTLNVSPVLNDLASPSSVGQPRKSTMLCTSLHPSFFTPPDTDLQYHTSPFLANPLTGDHNTPSVDSPDSLFLMAQDAITESENENLMPVLDVPDECSGGTTFEGLHGTKESLTSAEKLVLQYLSKELEIPTDEGSQIPTLDEARQVSSNPVIDLDCNENYRSSPAQTDTKLNRLHEAATSQKQRIRWTTELHDRFVDAVKALGGPDDKSISTGVESAASSLNNESDVHVNEPNRDVQVTQALRTQIEIQKLLYEQLKSQKELQIRIEQNEEFLRKLLEEQKTIQTHEPSSSAIPVPESELLPHSPSADVSSPRPAAVRSDCYLSQPSNHKASDTTDSEKAKCPKRGRGQKEILITL
ncbi:unnamed protein product [Dovyalis caffra]|uniref:MYB-CC type transcription factor LHEQLE-containing domain-containing protein n=1 Tax=Dovyalis caffra TaxID=77055 RepID=A0AAV1S356_9ROSI|nr:unnamed protein product [Dovyalis caffra]